MTTPQRHPVRIGAVLALVAVLTIGAAPAAAVGDTASTQASAASLEDDLESASVPTAVGPNESFTADASALADRDDVAEVCWRFDENGTCHDAETTHTFEEEGPHTATLIVTDENDERRAVTNLVTVTSAPVAHLTAPASTQVDATVGLNASDSIDDQCVETYEWDLTGDGEVDETTESPELEHAFEEAGAHEVTVTTVDAAGQSDTASATVEVAEPEESSVASLASLEGGAALAGLAIALAAVGIGGVRVARSRR
ncbi:PKD domain-containing protein [Natronococcus jeotgali]|uniref:PKD domain-containing protein n=1 Tax=Natronococcus jeotgali DSM 18795 TaxID=1227498 RepID=L9XWP6_9EURY|nr:PKD domain-containing protein [Natronococcus jeotgali]ELY66190.1 PKD domain-containing protein [Natronococcus jeotgali DSM 18795]